MLSGRYRTESLRRHWIPNSQGHCSLPSCSHGVTEDLHHILLICPSYHNTRGRILTLWREQLKDLPEILQTTLQYCNNTNSPNFMQFLLDPSVLPDIITLTQNYGQFILKLLFYLTRTYCHAIHKHRLSALGIR